MSISFFENRVSRTILRALACDRGKCQRCEIPSHPWTVPLRNSVGWLIESCDPIGAGIVVAVGVVVGAVLLGAGERDGTTKSSAATPEATANTIEVIRRSRLAARPRSVAPEKPNPCVVPAVVVMKSTVPTQALQDIGGIPDSHVGARGKTPMRTARSIARMAL